MTTGRALSSGKSYKVHHGDICCEMLKLAAIGAQLGTNHWVDYRKSR